jgi:chromosome partitioning protein
MQAETRPRWRHSDHNNCEPERRRRKDDDLVKPRGLFCKEGSARQTTQSAQVFFDTEAGLEALVNATIDLNPALNADIIPAYYDLQTAEELYMLRWLMGHGKSDLRFALCQHLQLPYFQGRYDAIIIDAPPRMTTGFINALCASTHLFVPSILDQMTAEATTFFAKQVRDMATTLFPNLEFGGVIPSRTSGLGSESLKDYESSVADFIDREIEATWRRGNAVLREAKIPNGAPFASVSGTDITYLGPNADAKRRIKAMGDAVSAVIGLPV